MRYLISLSLLIATHSFAATTAEHASAVIAVDVVEPVQLTKIRDVQFGVFESANVGRVIELSNAGISPSAGFNGNQPSHTGKFILERTNGQPVTVEIDNGSSTVTCSNGANAEITLTFVSKNVPIGQLTPIDVSVGAELFVPANATGSIDCPFTLVATYQ